MTSYNKSILAIMVATVLSVTACSKSGKAASAAAPTPSKSSTTLKPVEFAGVDLRTANRQRIEEAFAREFKVLLVPRNEWETIADASKMLAGAENVEIATTRNGAFASMQFTFPGSGDPKLTARVLQLAEAKYGKPTVVAGQVDQGEYRAYWDMDGDFIIQIARGWPDVTTYMMFVSGKNFSQLRDEYQKILNAAPKPKGLGE